MQTKLSDPQEDDCISSSSEEYDPDFDLSSEFSDLQEASDLQNPEEFVKTPKKRRSRLGSWILIRNYLLTAWQALEAKMLSSMSYTPPEVFAFNLKSKLETLRSSAQNMPTSEGSQANSNGNRLQQLIYASRSLDTGLLGTTFPPSRCVPLKINHKFHSETDLTAKFDAEELDQPDMKNGDAEMEVNQQDTESIVSEPKELENGQDSDLFFDFDIGSPAGEPVEDPEDLNFIEIRRSSESSCDAATNPSTAFGSTSSGLYSDADVKSTDELESKGFCIEPEDWLKSNFNDIISEKITESPEQVQDVSSDDTLDELDQDKTSICIGTKTLFFTFKYHHLSTIFIFRG